MAKKAYLLFTINKENNPCSKRLLGVFSKGEKAGGNAIIHAIESSEGFISSDDLFALCSAGATTSRKENYIIEEHFRNELIQKQVEELCQ